MSKYVHEARLLREFDVVDGSSRRAKAVAAGSAWSLVAVCGSRLSHRSLAYRLSFVAGRFGSHAPYWQASHNSLLITHYPLPITHYSLLTTHYSLLTTHHSPLTIHYSLAVRHMGEAAGANRYHAHPGRPHDRRRHVSTLPARCPLPAAHCPLPLPAAHFPLPAARYSLPAAHLPLPAARYSLSAACCPLPAARCLLLAACCLLPAAHCPLLAARYPLPACCPLPAAHCLLPAACCLLLPATRCPLPADGFTRPSGILLTCSTTTATQTQN